MTILCFYYTGVYKRSLHSQSSFSDTQSSALCSQLDSDHINPTEIHHHNHPTPTSTHATGHPHHYNFHAAFVLIPSTSLNNLSSMTTESSINNNTN